MSQAKRHIAALLLLVMISDLLLPLSVLALSTGPSQPEVQGFQPASAGDLVDLFTGDCSYNIPLLDVEGYPINLFYNGGVTMDQEASWVGLGWNLNPGVVERNMRGIPDDFRGDPIKRTMNLRPNRTYGVSYATAVQLFSVPILGPEVFGPRELLGENSFNLDISVAPSFNNYNGCEFELGLSFSMRSTKKGRGSYTAGLGMTSNSNRGLRMQPSFGFDSEQVSQDKPNNTYGLNFGMGLDSRQGLTGLSFGAVATSGKTYKKSNKSDAKVNLKGRASASYDLGSPTFSPQITLPMRNKSISFSFTVGGAAGGAHPNMTLGGFYSEQVLREKERTSPAYGYFHLDEGQQRSDAQLDFNREKDGPYSGDRAALGIPMLTHDVFSVSGQGVGGSYRAFRAEVGHVFDPYTSSNGSGGSFGLDVGAGLLAHGGARISVNSSNSHSGRWSPSSNLAGQRLRYRDITSGRPDLEKVYFREANEATVQQDSSLWVGMRRSQAMRFNMPQNGAFDRKLGAGLTTDDQTVYGLPGTNHRTKREPRSQLFTYLDHAMAQDFAVDVPPEHDGVEVRGHHMSEVSVLDAQGGRYVYGLPAYNVQQVDVEFNAQGLVVDPVTDLVAYSALTDASIYNGNGKDHYYSRTETPAYPYAFLLTSVLSNDYSDIDGIRGPSDGDLGTYTRFEYTKRHAAMGWRTPVGAHKARFIENSGGTPFDDKATYTYGTKEVYYLQKIETKNRVAIFHLSETSGPGARKDACGIFEHGALDGSQRAARLEKIELYSKGEDPELISTVNFEYDYSLCSQAKTNIDGSGGKLTLKKVWFTHGSSQLRVTSPYVFHYGTGPQNPTYDALAQDRWGNYKVNGTVPNETFPYAEQDPALADLYAKAWNLNKIVLPSGASIELEYEADDYAFVQDRRAMRMIRIVGMTATTIPTAASEAFRISNENNRSVLWFELPEIGEEPVDQARGEAIVDRLVSGIGNLYFRYRVQLWGGLHPKFDHVSGYAEIEDSGYNGSVGFGWVRLKEVSIDESGGYDTHPIFRAALEHFQVHYPDRISDVGAPEWNDTESVTKSFLLSSASSLVGFINGFRAFFQGPNRELASRTHGYCAQADLSQSWIRLNDPDARKKGGGHRIARVAFKDGWEESDRTYSYAQRYLYGDANGSWGVAAYEPMAGADENPFRLPVYSTVSNAFAPDERFYQEEPFGECMFPSPVVGYSKVVVLDDLDESLRTIQGTGRVEHEFHTAREFPSIVSRTGITPDGRHSNNTNLFAIIGFKKKDHMYGSQGFVVETNDMHGKPSQVTVFPENSDRAVSYVKYNYGYVHDGSRKRLLSTESVIDPNGNVRRADIGVDHEFVADTREFISRAMSGGADVKFEVLYALVAGIPIPLCLPKLSWESTRYRTGVLAKKIHRFGRLREVVKMENGSVVSTENLAYDAITGQVLVTRTRNDFKDPVYSMTFPAYWYHDGMGPAYRNMGTVLDPVQVNSAGRFQHPIAGTLFTPGDEVALIHTSGTRQRAWVDEVNGDRVMLSQRVMAPVAAGTYRLQVVRSGRRNLQGSPMMTLTSLNDPLNGLNGNVYANLLNAQALEYRNEWTTACACQLETPEGDALNPWLSNAQGVWRLHKENVWLTERSRSVANNNSNIRRDGVYASFDPFYKVNNGGWSKDRSGWTTTREVTHYNVRGQELENKDALGLYSAATFGHHGTMARSVARNAQYREIGFDGFEEPTSPVDCGDKHFRFLGGMLEINDAHTGRHSLKVSAGSPVDFTVPVRDCEERKCLLSVALDPEGTSVIVSNAMGAYNIVPELITGQVSFIPSPVGMNVISTLPGMPWSARISVSDASGCGISSIIQFDGTP